MMMFGKSFMQNINISSKRTLKSFFFYLFCFFPIFLVSGPFLPDLSLTLIIAYFLISILIKKEFYLFKNSFFVIFSLFYIYIFLNSVFVSGEFLSIKSSSTYLRFGLFVLAISYLISNNFNKINYFLISLLVTFLILFIDSIFQKIFGFNIIGLKMITTTRVSSFFGDELILGSFIIKFLPILIALVYFSKFKKKEIISIIILLASLVPIILSAEKAAILTYLIFFFLFVLVTRLKLVNKLMLIFSLVILISSILYSNQNIKKRLIDNLISNSQGGKYIFSQVHESHFKTAFNMFLDKPITGHGPKMFRIKCSDEKYQYDQLGCSTHPHNYYLQLLSETGLLGFSFLLLFYILILKNFIKQIYLFFKKQEINYTNYFLTCSLLLLFLPISVSGNFFNNWLAIIYSLSLGFFNFFNNLNLSNK
tara:strand:- start:1218 stop:2483 length:1266 start_codon:yes stop_codon:yes gene_type:complete